MDTKNVQFKRPVIYVAGPMTAPTAYEWELNIRRAEQVTLDLYTHGFSPHSPAVQSRYFRDNMTFEAAMESDYAIIFRADAVLFVDGWTRSKGSKLELQFCIDNSIPFFFSMEDLIEWKNQRQQQNTTALSQRHNSLTPFLS